MPEIFNVRLLHKAHKQFLTGFENLVAGQLAAAGEVGVKEVQRRPGFKPDTGATQRATSWRIARTRGGKLLRLRNTHKNAHILDKGSRPHVIRARRAPLLRFFWERKGVWVSTYRVKHPGTRPYRFLQHAAIVAGRKFSGRLRDGMRALGRRNYR